MSRLIHLVFAGTEKKSENKGKFYLTCLIETYICISKYFFGAKLRQNVSVQK
jgi:hypothetical protein